MPQLLRVLRGALRWDFDIPYVRLQRAGAEHRALRARNGQSDRTERQGAPHLWLSSRGTRVSTMPAPTEADGMLSVAALSHHVRQTLDPAGKCLSQSIRSFVEGDSPRADLDDQSLLATVKCPSQGGGARRSSGYQDRRLEHLGFWNGDKYVDTGHVSVEFQLELLADA